MLPSFLKETIKRLNDSIDPRRRLVFASFLFCIRWGKNKKKLFGKMPVTDSHFSVDSDSKSSRRVVIFRAV